MKKLIFGLVTFFTSVLGILGSMGIEAFVRYLYAAYATYATGLMETAGAALYVFVITAVIGFAFALIGAFSRDKKENKQ